MWKVARGQIELFVNVFSDDQDLFKIQLFQLGSDATKPEIKKAVEALFGKKVDSVQALNVKGKTKRTANGVGMRKGYRKAYVTLAAGETLEDFSGAE